MRSIWKAASATLRRDLRLALGALARAREEAQVAEAVARLLVGVVLVGELTVEPQIVRRGEQLRQDALRGGAVAHLDVARAHLLGRVELGGVLLVVGAHVLGADGLRPALVEALLEEAADHHLLARALDLREPIVAAPAGLLGEQLEADHLIEELAAPLRAAVAGADEGALGGELLGELPDRDGGVADARERLVALRLREAVHALALVVLDRRVAGGRVLAAAERHRASEDDRPGQEESEASRHGVECC
ncbi:MAG: hypothetical protein M5U28_25560 [Sandaracinaceae bacterium]|nr:hypothetical protein [Sandaracinaceae bacterium]